MALIQVLIVVTSFTVFYVILAGVWLPRATVSGRVEELAGIARAGTPQVRKLPMPRRKRTIPWMTQLDNVLRRAEIDVQGKEFCVRWGLITCCLAVLSVLVWGIAGAVIVLAVSPTATLLYLRARGQRRLRRFNEGLHDMLNLVVNSLRAGHSFAQALHVVVEEMSGPIQEEMQRIEAEMQVGVSTEQALERANDRIGSPDFDLVVTAMLIQRQVGGNLAEVLDKITETIRERVKLQREVKALTSQGRLSANLFMFMPAGVGAIIYMMNPSYIHPLLATPIGWAMLAVAGMGQAVGYVVIKRIVNVEL